MSISFYIYFFLLLKIHKIEEFNCCYLNTRSGAFTSSGRFKYIIFIFYFNNKHVRFATFLNKKKYKEKEYNNRVVKKVCYIFHNLICILLLVYLLLALVCIVLVCLLSVCVYLYIYTFEIQI